MRVSTALFGFALSACTVFPAVALACGVSGPDGVSACSIEEHRAEAAADGQEHPLAARPLFRVGVSGLFTSTALDFSGGLRADETRFATAAFVAYQPLPRLTLQVGAGAALGGHLAFPGTTYDFSPGPTVFAGASYRVVDGQPFVVLTSLVSFQAARTHAGASDASVGYEALDLRAGVLVGVTVFDVLSPYVVARGFGGPVFWRYMGEAVTGTDTHHYQVGLGASLSLPAHVGLFMEGVPLGEQAFGGGASLAF